MTKDLFIRYAELLRRAWLNPSFQPWQLDLYKFEHEHHDTLKPYFGKWQVAACEEQP